MGTRGIPATYGGFETFAEKISERLVQNGHEVTVYCRKSNYDYHQLGNTYKGAHLVVHASIRNKYFDTVSHTFLSILFSLKRNYDIILICNSVNSIFSFLPTIKDIPVVVNVDGLEWKRKKWNLLGKSMYRVSEWFATFLPTAIVTDSLYIKKYYEKRFSKNSFFIPYGAEIKKAEGLEILYKYGLSPREYFLYVSRLEPENNAHVVIKAFEKVETNMKLVIVGDAPYSQSYIRKLKKTKDKRIIFTGYVFGKGYEELQTNAYAYIQATEVGGTHPALLEAMAFGNCVIAKDVPEHREVLEDAGIYFNSHIDLSEKMQDVLQHPERIKKLGKRAQRIICKRFTWDKITNDYEEMFKEIAKHYRKKII